MKSFWKFKIAQSLFSQKEIELENTKEIYKVLEFFVLFNNSRISKKEKNLLFFPGKLSQKGKNIEVENICDIVDILLLIGMFFEDDIDVEFTGITNDIHSVDIFKITHWKIFGLLKYKGFQLNIKKRGFPPIGKGIVHLHMKNIKNSNDMFKKASDFEGYKKTYENFEFVRKQKIEKIRGLVISSRTGSECTFQMIKAIKECFKKFKNTKVMSIINNKNDSGPSPGFECSITAETKNGIFYVTKKGDSIENASNIAKECANDLMNHIKDEYVYDEVLINRILFYFTHGSSVGKLLCKKVDLDFIEFLKEETHAQIDVASFKNYFIVTVVK